MLATYARTFNTVLQFSRRCRSKVTAGAVRLQQRARLVYDSFTETRVEGIAHVDPRLMCARALLVRTRPRSTVTSPCSSFPPTIVNWFVSQVCGT